jgi:hypothetical protein
MQSIVPSFTDLSVFFRVIHLTSAVRIQIIKVNSSFLVVAKEGVV